MFSKEEAQVRQAFQSKFPEKYTLFLKIIKMFEKTLFSSTVPADDYNAYAAVILAGSSFKSLFNTYKLLSGGYIADAESLLKKAIEGFIYQAYFFIHEDSAKKYCIENIKPVLNIYDTAKELDAAQLSNQFFPTDYENFFTEYVYTIGYSQANRLSHLDFDLLHTEMGLDSLNPDQFSTTLVLGPKLEPSMMETSINRLIMFSMFQLSLLLHIINQKPDAEYSKTLNKVMELMTQFNSK